MGTKRLSEKESARPSECHFDIYRVSHVERLADCAIACSHPIVMHQFFCAAKSLT